MARKRREHVYGPYAHRDGCWKVHVVSFNGARNSRYFKSEADAREYAKACKVEVEGEGISIERSTHEYTKAQRDKGLRAGTLQTANDTFKAMFDPGMLLDTVTAKYIQQRLDEKSHLAVDTKAGHLRRVKTFLRWCVDNGRFSPRVYADIQ